MKSLAELRQSPPTERPQRTIDGICLRLDLVARMESLTTELDALPIVAGKPHANHEKRSELREQIDAVLAEMSDYEGSLVVRANLTSGEWRNWVNAHPPRAEGEEGRDRDLRATGGIANGDALIAELGMFAHQWNGEKVAEGDWAAVFAESIQLGKQVDIARTVVSMYEGSMDFRQWRSALSDGLKRSDAFALPEPSESAPSASMDGNPEPSSAD